jgi:hypothetical protein
MADYHSPTIVDPMIPVTDIDEMEQLLLKNIFEYDDDGGKLYFHHWSGPQTVIYVNREELEAALKNLDYDVTSPFAELAEQAKAASEIGDDIKLDFSEISYEFLFQNIVRRSATLKYILVITPFTCTKMRRDGFGGMATLITADEITGKSTHDIIADLLEKAGLSRKRHPPRGFYEAKLNGDYDLAIGNPPFSDRTQRFAEVKPAVALSLHDYFIAKSISALHPGGIAAFVVSRWTMDKTDSTARRLIAEMADLLGAVRLPERAMRQDAGTDVVVDLLFFQRRQEGQIGNAMAWLDSAGAVAPSEDSQGSR